MNSARVAAEVFISMEQRIEELERRVAQLEASGAQTPPSASAPSTRIWFTTAQAAEFCGRHTVTILKALEAGELHGRQRVTGGRWRIHVDCLEAWVNRHTCHHADGTTR